MLDEYGLITERLANTGRLAPQGQRTGMTDDVVRHAWILIEDGDVGVQKTVGSSILVTGYGGDGGGGGNRAGQDGGVDSSIIRSGGMDKGGRMDVTGLRKETGRQEICRWRSGATAGLFSHDVGWRDDKRVVEGPEVKLRRMERGRRMRVTRLKGRRCGVRD